MIKRIIENTVINSLNKFPITGIIGSRQCGKTTLAKTVTKKLNIPVLYLDLESTSDLRRLTDAEMFLNENSGKLIVIDEIQRMPNLFPILRSLSDKNRKKRKFLILGSANPLMMKYSSESLAGRISYLELSPFNIQEVERKYNINQHWLRGGYPSSLLAKNNNDSILWLDNFLKTYLERDFAQLGVNMSPFVLRNFLIMLAHNHGNLLNIALLSKSINISVPTINRYLDLLESSFLIMRLYPYYTNLKKRVVRTPKIYFRDSGILHRLLELSSFNNLMASLYKGNSWEGYIIQQILSSKKSGINLFFFRTQDGAEIDLVITKSNKVIATIEIKSSTSFTLSKGNYYSQTILKSKKNFVIIQGSFDYPFNENIRVCGILEFLNKHLPEIML